MKTLQTMKLVDAVRDLEHEKGYDYVDASRLAWVTLATVLTCAYEKGLGINQAQSDIDEFTERYTQELNELLEKKAGEQL